MIKNYSQDYVGLRSGISQNACSKIKLGYITLKLARFLMIADVFETDVNKMLVFPINGKG